MASSVPSPSLLAHSHPELQGAKYVVFVDASRHYIDCTDDACVLLGYSRREMIGKRIEDISYDVSLVPKLFAQYVKDGMQEGEYVLQRQDRTPLPIRYRAFVFSDGCHAAIWEPVGGWKELYMAALLETNPGKQGAKIEAALNAIRQNSSAPPHEQRQMVDATSMLYALRKNSRANQSSS